MAALGLLLGLGACTFVVTADEATQCSNDDQCRARGGAFNGSVCEAGVCVAGAAEACQTNADCASLGANRVCRAVEGARACVSLVSPECQVLGGAVSGNTISDTAFVFGTILVGADGSKAVEDGVRYALNEINMTSGGLPAIPTSGGRPRPVAFVGCSDRGDAQAAAAAVNHLVDVVGVPVILGASDGGTTDAIAQLAIDKRVLLVSPTSTSVRLTSLNNRQGFVWRTTVSDAYQADALAPFSAEVASARFPNVASLRAAAVSANNEYGSALRNQLDSKLTLNGRAATDPNNQAAYLKRDYNPTNAASIAAAVDAIKTQRPHLVFLFGGAESVEMVGQVEAAWATIDPPPDFEPIYFLADAVRQPRLVELVGTNNALRRRVFGTFARPNVAAYQTISREIDRLSEGEPSPFAVNAYDATYLIAYATAARGGGEITGATISKAFEQLLPGVGVPPVNAGTQNLNQNFSSVQAPEARIDFEGVSGPLDFNLRFGEAPGDIQIMCLPRNAANDAALPPVIGTRYFNAKKQQLDAVALNPNGCP